MMEVLPRPDPTIPDTTGEYVHLYCPCNPRFMFCGVYDETATGEEDDYGPPCRDCEKVRRETDGVCGRCGE